MVVTFRWAVALAVLCFMTCSQTAQAQGDDAEKPAPIKPSDKGASPKAGKPESKESTGQIAVPKNAKPADLIAFCKKLVEQEVEGLDEAARMAHLKKVTVALLDASKQVLAAEHSEDAEVKDALDFVFVALEVQRQLGLDGVNKVELQFAEKYSTDPRKAVSAMAKKVLPMARLRNSKDLKQADQELLLDDTIAGFMPAARKPRELNALAMELGRLLEDSGNAPLAAISFEKFADTFALSGKQELVDLVKKYQGMARRLRLPGNPIEIEGDLIDGTPIDWSAYKGKVVLIDFWATWCMPCVEEIPNIKKNYDDYHAKGFDVVAVCLDDEQERAELFLKRNKIPWGNIFSTKPDAMGMENPLAVKYGVMRIPCTILVGKDGKVIASRVMGAKLGEALKEHLGEPEKASK